MKSNNNIIILKMSALGDIIHAFPLANTLKKNIEGLRLGWIVEKQYEDIVGSHPAVDEVFAFERGGGLLKSMFGFRELIRKIKSGGYDKMIDLQGSIKGSPWVMFSGLESAGFAKGSSRVDAFSTLFTGTKVSENGSHIVERNLGFAKLFGIDTFDFSPGTFISADAAEKAAGIIERFLPGDRKIVAVHPGTTWATKMWPPKNYMTLINMINGRLDGASVIITAGRGEETLGESIMSGCRVPPFLARGLSMGELAALLARCSVFVGSDSGPLHLASAAGTRVVGLYGPTDPRRNGPFWGEGVSLTGGTDCAACWRKKCRGMDCMERIKAEDVFENVARMLNVRSKREAGNAVGV